jgi:hypothetical protein
MMDIFKKFEEDLKALHRKLNETLSRHRNLVRLLITLKSSGFYNDIGECNYCGVIPTKISHAPGCLIAWFEEYYT